MAEPMASPARFIENRKKMRSFFQNKNCDICRRQATTFRCIGNKDFMLCESKKCDLYTRVKTGFFELINFNKK